MRKHKVELPLKEISSMRLLIIDLPHIIITQFSNRINFTKLAGYVNSVKEGLGWKTIWMLFVWKSHHDEAKYCDWNSAVFLLESCLRWLAVWGGLPNILVSLGHFQVVCCTGSDYTSAFDFDFDFVFPTDTDSNVGKTGGGRLGEERGREGEVEDICNKCQQ